MRREESIAKRTQLRTGLVHNSFIWAKVGDASVAKIGLGDDGCDDMEQRERGSELLCKSGSVPKGLP
jgi:hypothetical protein